MIDDPQPQQDKNVTKRLLLVNPAGPVGMSDTPGMNVGLGYVASAFRDYGWEVRYADGVLEGADIEGFVRALSGSSPCDVVGLYVMTLFVPYVTELVERLRAVFPDAVFIAGGPHPSSAPELTLEAMPQLNAVLRGEVEGAFPELDAYLRGKGDPTSVPGLYTTVEGGAIVKGPSCRHPDLTDNPIPAWDLLRPDLYFSAPGTHLQSHGPAATTVFTRGCPHNCSFCNVHNISGRRVRARPIEKIIEELRLLREEYGVREIICMDDGLTIKRRFVLDLCEAIRRENLGLAFSCPYGVRLDTLDDEVLAALESAGFYHLSIGIEAGTQARLDKVDKKLRLDTILDRVPHIKKTTGLGLSGQFILGFPGETVREARETIALACRLPLDRANFFTLNPFPGTRLYEQCLEEGLIKRGEFEFRSAVVPGRSYAAYSSRRLHQLLIEAHLRFYSAPRRIASIAMSIRSPRQAYRLLKRVGIIFRGK